MNDRELLEAAAKACGTTVHEALGKLGKPISLYSVWNPLTDDGDALRLAVYLRIGITWDIGDTYVCAFELYGDATWCEYFSDHSHDPDAAMRRAIVRAAAAMAKEEV